MAMAPTLNVMEANRRLLEYVNWTIESIASQNGAALRDLLAISPPFSYRDNIAMALDMVKDVTRIVKQIDKHGQVADMLAQHMRCMQSYYHKNYVDSYNALEKSANKTRNTIGHLQLLWYHIVQCFLRLRNRSAFLQEFRNWETAWAMDALYTMVYELRTLAEMADREMATCGRVPDKLKGAGSFLMKVFGALAGKGPKRVGALYVTCQLFKVYFKLGTVHLCRSVIRSIETARVFDFEEFPTRDKVTYNYYTGRLEVFNDNFIAADQKLTYALVHCAASKVQNVRMILKYLIPVKLSLGILPKDILLQKYNLFEYLDIVHALRRGDIRLLRQALESYEDEFLRSGVYLVLEKLELQVYQRLMKKIHLIQKQKDPSKAHQVKMDVVVKALKWLQIDMDIDEVECIMAILIHKNLMKGYFSHKSKVVVLSKQDPFPKLGGRPVNP